MLYPLFLFFSFSLCLFSLFLSQIPTSTSLHGQSFNKRKEGRSERDKETKKEKKGVQMSWFKQTSAWKQQTATPPASTPLCFSIARVNFLRHVVLSSSCCSLRAWRFEARLRCFPSMLFSPPPFSYCTCHSPSIWFITKNVLPPRPSRITNTCARRAVLGAAVKLHTTLHPSISLESFHGHFNAHIGRIFEKLYITISVFPG